MANNTSKHILGTSANLLGFCLFVITAYHVTDEARSSHIDEFTSLIAFFLIMSCFFSFLSIKSENPTKEKQLEKIAEYMFIISLSGILLVIFFITINFIK